MYGFETLSPIQLPGTAAENRAWSKAGEALAAAEQFERVSLGLRPQNWPRPSLRAVIDTVAEDIVLKMLGESGERDLSILGDVFDFLRPDNVYNAYYIKSKEACREDRLQKSKEPAKAAAAAKTVTCEHCGKVCADESSYQTHLYEKSGNKHPVYDCVAWMAREKAAGRWRCIHCYKIFEKEGGLQAHLASLAGTSGHPEVAQWSKASEEKQYGCDACGACFASLEQLVCRTSGRLSITKTTPLALRVCSNGRVRPVSTNALGAPHDSMTMKN